MPDARVDPTHHRRPLRDSDTVQTMQPAPFAAAAARLFAATPESRLALLRALWPVAVGSELADRTRVESLHGNTLRVRVPDAGWRRQLHDLQPNLLRRLRELAGRAAPWRLGFVEGALPAREPRTATPAPRRAELSAELQESAASIADPELRAAFLESARLYLGRVTSLHTESERDEGHHA